MSSRVCIFIDNSNLFYAIKNNQGFRIDYGRLKNFLAKDRQATVRFYCSEPTNPHTEEEIENANKRDKFYGFLRYIGFDVFILPLKERITQDINGEKQLIGVEKGLDCEIVYDMCSLSRMAHFDTFILVAGDADYTRTVERIRKETGIQVEVAFFSDSGCSLSLQRECSKFIDLSQYKDEIRRE